MNWERISPYEVRMILIIKDYNKNDVGTYMCVASNTMGKAEGNIRLYGTIFYLFNIDYIFTLGNFKSLYVFII